MSDDLAIDTPGWRFARAFKRGELRGGRGVQVETRALLDTGTAEPWLAGYTPQGPMLATPRLVRDLLSVVPASALTVPYIREINAATNETGATGVSEGAAKPEVTIEFEGGELRARKLTAWIPATMEIFDDAAGLAAYVDSRLWEQLGNCESDQIVNGSGTAPAMLGILNTGVQTQTAVTGDVPATLAAAVAKVEAKRTRVTGIVINSADYWTGRTTRSASGLDDDVFDTEGNIFGIPTVRTAEIAAGTCLVGNFEAGATLREYKPVTIRTSTEHDDFFVKNKVAVVAETQEAVTVQRPDYFCEASISFS